MENFQLRDPEFAKSYLLEGILLSRTQPVSEATVELALRLAMEITSDGTPLPPLGLVVDIGIIATNFGTERPKLARVPGFDDGIARKYEDYVLGKIYSDISFERAIDAIARYENRDKDRAIAYLICQLCRRCNVGGAILSPAVIKTLQKEEHGDILLQAHELISSDGISSDMCDDYESVITSIQSSGELLGVEDVFELEHGTALAEFGQRIALRQVLRVAAELQKDLPNQKPRSRTRSYSVATNILEEDFYPVGGFSSISNKGTIESLLRSELAYIDKGIRPDLFDIKFARGELLYYSRDENQFLRRRLTFVFTLYPDLVAARFKDSQLQWQRIILVMAILFVIVNRLTQWLSDDSLKFHFLFADEPGADGLDDEINLLETLFREQMENGTVEIQSMDNTEVGGFCDDLARKSLCQNLLVTSRRKKSNQQLALVSQLIVNDIQPTLELENDTKFKSEEADLDGWREALNSLLRFWV